MRCMQRGMYRRHKPVNQRRRVRRTIGSLAPIVWHVAAYAPAFMCIRRKTITIAFGRSALAHIVATRFKIIDRIQATITVVE